MSLSFVPSSAPAPGQNMPSVSIAVWSDIVCPWCFIGERRLRHALAAAGLEVPSQDVELHWRPFQLQPEMPASGVPWADYARAKFGGATDAEAAFASAAQAGASEQINFRFDQVSTAPNTVDAHRLLLLAETGGRLAEAVESFYTGYFSEGANLNDADTLIALAARAGVDAPTARALLQSDRFQAEVRESQREADELGMRGVPFYTFRAPDGHQWGINGAAAPAVFADALNAAARHAV